MHHDGEWTHLYGNFDFDTSFPETRNASFHFQEVGGDPRPRIRCITGIGIPNESESGIGIPESRKSTEKKKSEKSL